jgi:steroid delta-isomerase-like uncharacterized protein
MITKSIKKDVALIEEEAPRTVLQSVLTALNLGNISGAVDQFADDFTFTDHALNLEFTDKDRLIEFFHKSRELFPDSRVEVVSAFESGDVAIAEWELTATKTYSYGFQFRFPIRLHGSTIVEIKNGRVARWSDYYDQNASQRVNLAAQFAEWIEY